MPTRIVAVLLAMTAATLLPTAALAQYKNTTFGFDAAYGINVRPSAFDEDGVLLEEGFVPIRLFTGGRFGVEYNYKMSADHWWLDMRINFGWWVYGGDTNGDNDAQYDAAASEAIGTVMTIEGLLGVRYVFMTDRFRPYIQAAFSYMRLISFLDADDTCPELVCGTDSDETEYDTFLPHENAVALHLQPGIEWVFTRDVALHFYVDCSVWFAINASPVGNFNPGVGLTFFL